jgi:hypothetical protein
MRERCVQSAAQGCLVCSAAIIRDWRSSGGEQIRGEFLAALAATR